MRRREFLGVLGGAATSGFPLAARAQDRMRRIGILVNLAESDSAGSKFVAAFRQSWRLWPSLARETLPKP
jgi:hypothetical protein